MSHQEDAGGQENAGGQELAVRPAASVLTPLNVGEVKESMQTYQQGLRELLDDSDYQDAGRGESFVKKSGWRKIATWFGLSVEIASQRVERDEQGEPLRASVIARAVAPNGRVMEGDGHCAATEGRFRSNRGKIENDLINTATTRAKNRAIADLVGMGAVSAEEVDANVAGPSFGPAANEDLERKLVEALSRLMGGPEKVVPIVEKLAKDAGGYLPRQVARGVAITVAAWIEQFNPEAAAEAAPEEEAAPDGSSDDEQQPQDGEPGGPAGDDEAGADEAGADEPEVADAEVVE